jgi:superfamily II DNA or RNA helicase
MEMIRVTKTKIILPHDGDDVKAFLTFNDKSVGFMISKLKKNFRFAQGDPEKFKARLDELKEQQNKCLLFYDVEGNPWTYSGLASDLTMRFGWTLKKQDLDVVSERSVFPWKKMPPPARYYQDEAFEELIKDTLGAVELPTGSGKTLIILKLLKHFSIKTLIITPFSNITNQLRLDLEESFGVRYVGQYGDGKKKTDKLFTVATAQSISRIKKNSVEWDNLSQCGMVIFDESHMVPAESFKTICLDGVASMCKHRYFLSATQTRTDGSEMLLKGITGPVVYRKTYIELANQGFLKKVNVKFFNVSPCRPPKEDPKKETRSNLYTNPSVAKFAAELAEKAYKVAGRQTVILIEEYEQFLLLKNFLTIPYEFAHGTVGEEAKKTLPKEYWKCDVNSIIEQFNKGNLPILIGTTAIATGVDIRPTGCIIYLQGGTSEIKVKQGVGRGTRPVAHTDLWVIDFNIVGSPTLERHARARSEIYKTLTENEVASIGS